MTGHETPLSTALANECLWVYNFVLKYLSECFLLITNHRTAHFGPRLI